MANSPHVPLTQPASNQVSRESRKTDVHRSPSMRPSDLLPEDLAYPFLFSDSPSSRVGDNATPGLVDARACYHSAEVNLTAGNDVRSVQYIYPPELKTGDATPRVENQPLNRDAIKAVSPFLALGETEGIGRTNPPSEISFGDNNVPGSKEGNSPGLMLKGIRDPTVLGGENANNGQLLPTISNEVTPFSQSGGENLKSTGSSGIIPIQMGYNITYITEI